MPNLAPQPIFRQDYRIPDYLIETIDITFDLGYDSTIVYNVMTIHRNPAIVAAQQPALELNGELLKLEQVLLNDRLLQLGRDYDVDENKLTIKKMPESAKLTIQTRINPKANTALTGLYLSDNMFCTQCEAHGFRRITYYLDRPDVMARFTTTLIADKALCPVLLSNGNRTATWEVGNDKHAVRWQDPFPKPCYLFALVAGDLGVLHDKFITRTKRQINLEIYAKPVYHSQCLHAMQALKKAMHWDEEVYGLEYDLDSFMIVAADDFNMGAMENKGLNIFNTKYILANPLTATDVDFQNIERVVAHEYFHNWTGNRVTVRDWFQLSLKEGLTVFRDQEFSADTSSRAIRRIEDTHAMRTAQFAEDSGPMAHPIRPDSYIEMNNFYTVTVYEKGAEVIRMIHTLLGKEGFRKGMDLYFARHDGQAVTTDDFVKAMADANNFDFSQFLLWYSQAGTPVVTVTYEYHPAHHYFEIKLKQHTPPTPGQPSKKPLHIPIVVALFDKAGNKQPLQLIGDHAPRGDSAVLDFRKSAETFRFINVKEPVMPSVLRNFSAPVRLHIIDTQYNEFLLEHDDDSVNRWTAMQQLLLAELHRLAVEYQNNFSEWLNVLQASPLISAWGNILQSAYDPNQDKALIANLLMIPSLHYLAQSQTPVHVEALTFARQAFIERLASKFFNELLAVYQLTSTDKPYQFTPQTVAARALKNRCLEVLLYTPNEKLVSLSSHQIETSDNMTEAFGALSALILTPEHYYKDAQAKQLEVFYHKWKHEPLVVVKWLRIQAMAENVNTLAQVKGLMQHPGFEITNPNKVYALIGTFAKQNFVGFHQLNGEGYEFVRDCIIKLDKINPQVAAHIATAFSHYHHYDTPRSKLMVEALQFIVAQKNLSKDVYEIVTRTLENNNAH